MSNLRPAPWALTPALVGRILAVSAPRAPVTEPVAAEIVPIRPATAPDFREAWEQLLDVKARLAGEIARTPAAKPRKAAVNTWSDAEDAIIRLHYPEGGPEGCKPLLSIRTPKEIERRASSLGVRSLIRGHKRRPSLVAAPPVDAPVVVESAHDRVAIARSHSPRRTAFLGAPRGPAPRPPSHLITLPIDAAPATRLVATARKPVPVSWAERQMAEVQAAKAFLVSRGFNVTSNANRMPGARPSLPSWHVSGWTGALSNEELIDFAAQVRMGATAREAAE